MHFVIWAARLFCSVPLECSEEQQPDGAAAKLPCQPEQLCGVAGPHQQTPQQAAAAAADIIGGAQPPVASGPQVDEEGGLWAGSPERRQAPKLRRLRKAAPSGAAAELPCSTAGGAHAATPGGARGPQGSLHSVPCERDGRQGVASAEAGADGQQHSCQPGAGMHRLTVVTQMPSATQDLLADAQWTAGAWAGRKRGLSLVGQKVEVFWEDDDEWYPGRAAWYDGDKVQNSARPTKRINAACVQHNVVLAHSTLMYGGSESLVQLSVPALMLSKCMQMHICL
jgi:hypothetical protein